MTTPDGFDNFRTVLYKGQAFQLAETDAFHHWLGSLADRRATARIVDRIKRASNGNFGDAKSVGSGVSEMRIDYGPGVPRLFLPARQGACHPALRR